MEAQVRNWGLDRKRSTSPSRALSVGSDAERNLGSNPRQVLPPIGTWFPLPSSPHHATAITRDRPILRCAGVPCALSAHGVETNPTQPRPRLARK